MAVFKKGNILEEQAQALVNTVNCVGVMGKGIALQFKKAYPENFKQYKKICDAEQLKPGQLFIFETAPLLTPRYIINFPTKLHWRQKSKIEYIKDGLAALRQEILARQIRSIAIPPLGCGNGGLNWHEVKPLIVDALDDIPDLTLIIYEPGGAPSAGNIKIATESPKMTRSQALLVKVFDLYGITGYLLSRLEAQKLAYFLQETGEPLKLNYYAHLYGPYADNLNHVLERIDGHFITGFGDRDQRSQISVLPEARVAAEEFLEGETDKDIATTRLSQVANLITGFETPYGMEMLATLHWVAKENQAAQEDVNAAIDGVQNWSERKKKLFSPAHLEKAWQRLHDSGWMPQRH